MVHVLYVIDSLDRAGGAEQSLAAVAPGLVRRGVRLDVACLRDRPGLREELVAAGVCVHAVAAGSRPRAVRSLVQLVRGLAPDLVHTTLYEADISGRLAATVARVPVVSSLVNAAYGPEHLHTPGLRPWKVRAAQAADVATARVVRRFHAISNHVADVMSRRLIVARHRIEVIPRGRDAERLATRDAAGRAAVRAELGIPDSTILLLAAARHEYQKGLDVLVAALPEIRRQWPDLLLLVAGRSGSQTQRLRAAAEQAGVTPWLRLLGSRDDVPRLMGAADVFVAPSRWEGLGSAALEAMGVGVPLVVSDVPALRELVGSPECARLVAPGDPSALARGVLACLSDPTETRDRAAAASRRFAAHFTLPATIDRTLDFYRRSIAG